METTYISVNTSNGSLRIRKSILEKMSYFKAQLDRWTQEPTPVLDAGLISNDQFLNVCQMLDTPVLVKPLDTLNWENICEMFGINYSVLPSEYFTPERQQTKAECLMELEKFIRHKLKENVNSFEVYIPKGITLNEAKKIAIFATVDKKCSIIETTRPAKRNGKKRLEVNKGKFIIRKD